MTAVRLDKDGSITTVWLSRPPVNAIDQSTYRELTDVFSRLSAEEGVRCVILAAEGDNFCAGNDLDEFLSLSPTNSPGRMRVVREAFFAVHDCAVPVIAAVQGVALGTGLALVASCDFAVCAAGAKLGTPEVSVGIMGGAKHLARLVPEPVVRWMYLSAEPVTAEELLTYGAIVAVVPRDELHDEARRRAEAIARHSPAAVRFAKRSLNAIEHMELKEGYEFEQSLSAELSAYADAKEAVRAFFERRSPSYTGQ